MKNILLFILFLTITNLNAQKEVDCDKFLEVLNENRILVQKGNAIGVIDTIGNVIIDFKYKQITYYNDNNKYVSGNKTLLATKLATNKQVLLNLETGKNIIENIENAKVRYIKNGYAVIADFSHYIDKKRFYINSNGKILFEIQKTSNSFHRPSYVSENTICVLTNPVGLNFYNQHKSKYIYVDTLGVNKFNKSYISAGDFNNQRAINAEYKNDQLYYGFIDNKGNQIINPIYTIRPTDFSDNVSRVQGRNKKYGYIDNLGKLIIEPKYSRASGFYKGFALVKDDYYGKWKIIDKTDKVIKEFTNLKRIISAMNSDLSKKKIRSIRQIIKEGLFKVTFNTSQYAIIDFDENIFIDFKPNKIRINEFKHGLTISSKFDRNSRATTYTLINKSNKRILINRINKF